MQLQFGWPMLVAALAGFATGAVWYTLLGGAWLKALGTTKEDMRPSPVPFIIAAAANLLVAFVLGNVMLKLSGGGFGGGGVTAVFGLVTGFFMWAGFTIPFLAMNNAFAGQ